MTLPELGVMTAGRGRAMLDLARKAESAGFHHLWSADGNGGDALAAAAAVASATENISIGTAVALRVRSPLQTVFGCATVFDLTNGKFVFGIGAGPKERIEDWHGLQHDPAVGRMKEYVTLLRLLWDSSDGKPVTYEGKYYRVRDYARPPSAVAGSLPIYLGCAGPLMTKLAGELADGLIVHVLHSPKMVAEQTRPALEQGAKRVGRSLDGFRLGAGLFTAVDDDRAVAYNRARHQILWAMTVPYNPPLLERAGFPEVAEVLLPAIARSDYQAAIASMPEEFVRELALVGTPAEVTERLHEWGEIVDFVTLNGIGAYMNVVPAEWRLTWDDVERNRQAIWKLVG